MNVEYHRWWSEHLYQEMELKVYGHGGKAVLVFPAQGGRFFEFEDFGMISAANEYIESGQFTFYTIDSVDNQSWANGGAHPADRARRHEEYDRYVQLEVIPFIRARHEDLKIVTAGCSMGGYHAANFFFRHPDTYGGVISLSGLFSLRHFIGDYMDDAVYFNSPLHYLVNMNEPWYLDLYRQSKIIICVGQGAWEEEMQSEAGQIKAILDGKGVNCWVDFWGQDVNHDWPWWRIQLPYFLGKIAEGSRGGMG